MSERSWSLFWFFWNICFDKGNVKECNWREYRIPRPVAIVIIIISLSASRHIRLIQRKAASFLLKRRLAIKGVAWVNIEQSGAAGTEVANVAFTKVHTSSSFNVDLLCGRGTRRMADAIILRVELGVGVELRLAASHRVADRVVDFSNS
jgi:hypothetical protein